MFQPKSRAQSWMREPVNSAANEGAAMMSQCLIISEPREPRGFLQVPNDIIENWFWRLLQAVFYETWNCWTKQKTSWTGPQKSLIEHEGPLLMVYQYSLAWKTINYFLFTSNPGREGTTETGRETRSFRIKHLGRVCGDIFDTWVYEMSILHTQNYCNGCQPGVG